MGSHTQTHTQTYTHKCTRMQHTPEYTHITYAHTHFRMLGKGRRYRGRRERERDTSTKNKETEKHIYTHLSPDRLTQKETKAERQMEGQKT